LFQFYAHHQNNNYGLHEKSYVVPKLIIFYENSNKQRNELEEQDDFEHDLVKVDDASLKLLIDNLPDGGLFIEIIVGLLDDIRNKMNHFTFGQKWLFDV